ncbi:hypothetical protein VPNG_08313 [Cytospora leucostoma]|uniref:Zn(2)-C6 fungal-type domain-containing protein n=1 Tax=Cytospora leucostoma TaxID=1230097 RepID=A0A423W9N5_9PEZI|nr:hypothetical protein VPNG_08313 [Cytospora leucostoma]
MSSSDEGVPPATTMRPGARRATTMNAAIPTSSSMTAAIESVGDAAGGAAQTPGASGQAQTAGADFGQAQVAQLPAHQFTGMATTAGQSSNAGAQSASQSSIANMPGRISQVCSDCRRRKIKCVRTEGNDKCENCVKREIDCIPVTAAPKNFTTMAGGSRSTAAKKKAGRKAGKKVAGKRVAQKKGKGRAQAKAPRAREHENGDGGDGGDDDDDDDDASVDLEVVDDAVDATAAAGRNPFHPIVAGGLTLDEGELAKVAANPAVVEAAKTPAPSDVAYQMDLARDPAAFQQEHNLGEPSYVGSLDDTLGGPLLNTAGELLDQYAREHGLPVPGDDDDLPDDYVAPYDPTLGPEPDYFALGLPVPARDEFGEPIIETPAAQPEPAAAHQEEQQQYQHQHQQQQEPEVEILGSRPAQQPAAQTLTLRQLEKQPEQASPAPAPAPAPAFAPAPAAASTGRPANFGDITTYAMRPAPPSAIEVHERAKKRWAEIDRAEAAAKAKRNNSGQSSSSSSSVSSQQQAAALAPVAPVVAPRGPTNFTTTTTTNMGPPPRPSPAPVNTMVQNSLDPTQQQQQQQYGPIFAEGTVPHQYSANKLLYLIEKQRADMMHAAMGGVSQLQAGRVGAARAAALQKWDEVNEGQDPAAYYDVEGREYLLRK